MNEIATILQKWIVKKGTKPQALAKIARVSVQSIKEWIAGDTYPPPQEFSRLIRAVPQLRHVKLPDDSVRLHAEAVKRLEKAVRIESRDGLPIVDLDLDSNAVTAPAAPTDLLPATALEPAAALEPATLEPASAALDLTKLSFGACLRQLRLAAQLSPPQLADLVGASRTSVHRWEKDAQAIQRKYLELLFDLFPLLRKHPSIPVAELKDSAVDIAPAAVDVAIAAPAPVPAPAVVAPPAPVVPPPERIKPKLEPLVLKPASRYWQLGPKREGLWQPPGLSSNYIWDRFVHPQALEHFVEYTLKKQNYGWTTDVQVIGQVDYIVGYALNRKWYAVFYYDHEPFKLVTLPAWRRTGGLTYAIVRLNPIEAKPDHKEMIADILPDSSVDSIREALKFIRVAMPRHEKILDPYPDPILEELEDDVDVKDDHHEPAFLRPKPLPLGREVRVKPMVPIAKPTAKPALAKAPAKPALAKPAAKPVKPAMSTETKSVLEFALDDARAAKRHVAKLEADLVQARLVADAAKETLEALLQKLLKKPKRR